MHGMKLVFLQVQREGELLVIELRLEGDVIVGSQPREQVAKLGTAVESQA